MHPNRQGLGRCTRCDSLPDKIEGKGNLYFWFPVAHTLNKVIATLAKMRSPQNSALKFAVQGTTTESFSAFEYELMDPGKCLRIELDQPTREILIQDLSKKLTKKELHETKVLWMSDLEPPNLSDFADLISLYNFITLNESNWLLDLLSSERLTSYFQPIVEAQDTSKIFAYEALLRGFDEQGNIISPGRMFSQAEAAGLIFQLDALARQCAIREANRHDIHQLIFVNFSPTSVYDPTTCLRTTVRAIAEAGLSHDQVVFEVAESDQPPDLHHLIEILKFYRDAGFLIALDDFGSGYSNLNLIHQLRPDFVKLDMHLIRNVHQDSYKALITEKLLEIAHSLEIQTIAEGVESVEELQWVRDRGASFVQGFLVAQPTTPPAQTTPLIEPLPPVLSQHRRLS